MNIIVDGNKACSNIAYLFTEISCIYPITPSSPMAANIDLEANTNRLNMFGRSPKVIEMQSEAGASGAMHGSLLTGSLSTTFTSSQGLLLMMPNMYKMAGELLPGVIHVAARSIATHALSIFGDHQDIYAVRPTGFAILASSSVSDAQNLAAVAHLSAIKGSIPFIHFFDGFRTSHEINTIKKLEDEDVLKLIDFDAVNKFKKSALNLDSTFQCGLAQNEDVYFQNTEARNTDYLQIPDVVNLYMEKINGIMNTNYKPFVYYGAKNAKNIIVAMGSVTDVIKRVIDYSADELGLIETHLYRPFSKEYLLNVLPKSAEKVAVLDRTKEHGSIGEPLYLDVVEALKEEKVDVVGGRYGLSSKDVSLEQIYSVFHMLKINLKNNFTIGIEDDVTNLSLERVDFNPEEKIVAIKIYGFGSDGMVSASKSLINNIYKNEGLYVQAYFEYDSKKSGGVTVSSLKIANDYISAPYYIKKSDLVVVTKESYLQTFDIVDEIKKNGTILINTDKDYNSNSSFSKEELEYIKKSNITVYTIDAVKIANKYCLKEKISKIMEFATTLVLKKDYKSDIEESIKRNLALKGKDIINSNINALNEVSNELRLINLTNTTYTEKSESNDFFSKIRNRKGNTLKVSEFLPIKSGKFKYNLTKDEKRNTSDFVPKWNKDNCIQCTQCSFVCPHAVIRPFISKEEKEDTIVLVNNKEYNFQIVVSEEDCTGCGLCVSICPGKGGEKALRMERKTNPPKVRDLFEAHINDKIIDKFTLKGSQLEKPLFEFSGACAGCGEAGYIKLLTQLYGDNIVIANATGCSSIYGGSVPSTPYKIPWANSLFEDNAEFALGMHLSFEEKRNQIKDIVTSSINAVDQSVKEIFESLLNNFSDASITKEIKEKLEGKLIPKELENLMQYIPKRSVWAVGGDGWAYDIGYGGLDHVLHTGESLKFLILDTEVYSNTGGQASKGTNLGAEAEFASGGKNTHKKDLFRQVMSIPNVYVASISLTANPNHTLKVFKEAEEHNGPAVIIAYSPCIEHGIDGGLTSSIKTSRLAVESGYQLLMRYFDDKLYLDSPEPNFEKYFDYLENENRFHSLILKNKEEAMKLFTEQKNFAIKRYNYYKNIKHSD